MSNAPQNYWWVGHQIYRQSSAETLRRNKLGKDEHNTIAGY